MRTLTRALIALVVLAALVLSSPGAAAAQSDGLTIPSGTVIYGQEGDVVELGRIPVDQSLAGPLCTWSATATNQASTHPGSDILIESNGTTLVLADVEATPNKVTTNSGSVALASEVVVSIRLGPDGRFSGRMIVTIDYSNCPPETTTTTEATTTTESTEAPEPETTETTAAPSTESTEATVTDSTEAPVTEPTEPAGPVVSQSEPTTTATTAAPTSTQTTEAAAPTTDTLPVTGSSLTTTLAMFGALLLLAGIGLTAATRFNRSQR